jgi:hypothetical protein
VYYHRSFYHSYGAEITLLGRKFHLNAMYKQTYTLSWRGVTTMMRFEYTILSKMSKTTRGGQSIDWSAAEESDRIDDIADLRALGDAAKLVHGFTDGA